MLAHKKQQISEALLASTEPTDNQGDHNGQTGPPHYGHQSSYHNAYDDSSTAYDGGTSMSKSAKEQYFRAHLIPDKFEATFLKEFDSFTSDQSKLTISEPRTSSEKYLAIF
jgi:hypothetical protein